MQDWHLLFKTRDRSEASIIQGMLEENEIAAQILNKLDSSYLNFGELEIYVPAAQNTKAKDLMRELKYDL